MTSTEPVRRYSGLTNGRIAVSVAATLIFDDARTNGAEEDDEANDTPLGEQPNLLFRELKNLDAANPIYIGKDATVTAATGHRIDPGQPFTLGGAGGVYLGPIYGIATNGTVAVSTLEY